jgi:hypothetical protein
VVLTCPRNRMHELLPFGHDCQGVRAPQGVVAMGRNRRSFSP